MPCGQYIRLLKGKAKRDVQLLYIHLQRTSNRTTERTHKHTAYRRTLCVSVSSVVCYTCSVGSRGCLGQPLLAGSRSADRGQAVVSRTSPVSVRFFYAFCIFEIARFSISNSEFRSHGTTHAHRMFTLHRCEERGPGRAESGFHRSHRMAQSSSARATTHASDAGARDALLLADHADTPARVAAYSLPSILRSATVSAVTGCSLVP